MASVSGGRAPWDEAATWDETAAWEEAAAAAAVGGITDTVGGGATVAPAVTGVVVRVADRLPASQTAGGGAPEAADRDRPLERAQGSHRRPRSGPRRGPRRGRHGDGAGPLARRRLGQGGGDEEGGAGGAVASVGVVGGAAEAAAAGAEGGELATANAAAGRVALCFFGLNRSLKWTGPSLAAAVGVAALSWGRGGKWVDKARQPATLRSS